MNTKLTTAESNVLWGTSFTYLIPLILSFEKELYDITLSTSIVLFSSIIYWSEPNNKFKMYIDYFSVYSISIYHIYISLYYNIYIFFVWSSLSVLFHKVGIYLFYNNDNFLPYIYCHIGLHIFSCLSSVKLIEEYYLQSKKI